MTIKDIEKMIDYIDNVITKNLEKNLKLSVEINIANLRSFLLDKLIEGVK